MYKSVNTLTHAVALAALVNSHINTTKTINNFDLDIIYTRFYFMVSIILCCFRNT
jgi:hypothetical protein